MEDLTTIPGLQAILRARLLSKVRIFSAWCEKGDRLLHVVRVGGRPIAFAREASPTIVAQVGAPTRRTMRHRVQPRRGMWLDLDPHLYHLAVEPPRVGGSRIFAPLRFAAQCQHEHVSISSDWLRAQVEQGVRNKVIDAAARREMGARPRGE